MPRAEPKKKRPPAGSPAAGGLVALGIVILGGIGIVLVLRGRSESSAPAAAAPAERVPFADYPAENDVPGKKGKTTAAPVASGERASRITGTGLAADPRWVAAVREAEQAYALLEQAAAARTAEDHALYQEKGKLAKEAFDRAIIATAEWEVELIATHGESNAEVRAIVATRSDWFEKLRVLHKTTGR